ncbi:5-formyltetrahydrofolate cyclo-ligase [Bacillus carboniphilus]|uniref:5-formyltetrahydrofolate cyclo-ligase n=1 Tax=Bacillus carboniphilus TaxID=86663 RepID=A0ABP3GKT5_9BACI
MTKDSIRKIMKTKLKKLSKPEYEQKSFQIARELFSSDAWKNAETIGITISNPPEVDTYFIIKQAWLDGKRVAVPRCITKEKKLDFRFISSFDQLENIYIHLWEPKIEITQSVTKQEIELLVVPGLAFNKEGYRVGFGGGYYDRYLVDFDNQTISLAFAEQLVVEMPIDTYDKPVKQIVTENGFHIVK